LFRAALGDIFVDYFVLLKRSEWDRYLRSGASQQSDDASEWEQNEYFDFF
jgi:glutamine synthetase